MKPGRSPHSILRTPAGVTVTLTLLGVAGYAVWIFTPSYSYSTDLIVAGLGLVTLSLLLSGIGLGAALRSDLEGSLRSGWLLITLGGGSLALAYASLFSQEAGLVDPVPGVVDAFRLFYYVLVLIGLMFFPASLVGRGQRNVLYLDLIILVLVSAMIYWYIIWSPSLIPTRPDLMSYIVLIYPGGDLLILAATLALAQRDLSPPARWMLLAIATAMICGTVADFSSAYFQLNEIPNAPFQFVHALWMGAGVAFCAGGAIQLAADKDAHPEPPRKSNPTLYMLRLTLPYLSMLIGLGLLVQVILILRDSGSLLYGTFVGTVVMVVLVLLRQYLVMQENLRLYNAVQRVAWTDGLTGLYNRHFFNEMLPREMDRSRRYKDKLSILLLDVDGFKKYNDTYGHLQGDVVLKSAAKVFSSQLRASDVIARFGGDEFVIILPSASRRLAQTIAQRIQVNLARQVFHGTSLGVTIGVGVFRDGQTPEQLLEEADQDLYRHKAINNNGRVKLPVIEKPSLRGE